jgi:hypothetical protein
MIVNNLNKFTRSYPILPEFTPFYPVFLVLKGSMHAYARIENLKIFIFGME